MLVVYLQMVVIKRHTSRDLFYITTAQADAAMTEWKEYAASPFASQVRNECIQNERVDFFWNKVRADNCFYLYFLLHYDYIPFIFIDF
jgi:hypothetical protein